MTVLSALYVSRRPAVAFVVVGLFWGCFAAFVPVIKAQLGANDALFGFLLLGSATGLVSAMWVAPKADKILSGRSMQFGVILLALAWLLPPLVSTPFIFAGTLAFVGMASGLLDVVMNARVSELEAKYSRPLMNANHAMFSVAYAVAATVTGLAREAGIPPIYVFVGFGILAVLLVPVIYMDVDIIEPADGVTGNYPLWPVLTAGAIVFVAFMSEATVEAWSALHIERTLDGGAAEGAFGPAMLGFTMALGRFSGQAMSERMHEVNVIIGAACLTASGALIAALALAPIWAYVGFGIFGLGVSVIGPLGLAIVGRIVPPHLRTDAISKAAVMGFSGFFFAPVLMGLVSEAYGLRVAYCGVAMVVLLAVPLTLTVAQLLRVNGRS